MKRQASLFLALILLLLAILVSSTGFSGCGKSTSLSEAAAKGRKREVKAFIANGADVNEKTETYGWTPLMDAAMRGHADIVKILVDAGADVNAQNLGGDTALSWASTRGYIKVVRVLLGAGADPNKGEALFFAVFNRHIDVVKALLEKGANVHVDGMPEAYQMLKRTGQTEMIELLKNAGVKE